VLSDAPQQGIRPFAHKDADDTARLFLRVFKHQNTPPPPALTAAFRFCFLHDEQPAASMVHVEEDSTVTGFVGVLAQNFMLNGAAVRVAVVGSLMVDQPSHNPLAGARLLRAVTSGPYDAVISETANPVSQRMWEKLGGHAVAGYSLDYIRVLRPAGFATALASHWHKSLDILALPARLIDTIAQRPFDASGQLSPHYHEDDLDHDEAIATLLTLTQPVVLKPALDPAAWKWRLEQASIKQAYGAYIARAVFDRRNTCVGAYFYHGGEGAIAHVLNIFGSPEHMPEVIARLIVDAHQRGNVALRGRATPATANALGLQKAGFLHRSSFTVYTRDTALSNAVNAGNAFMTGLAGETWMPLIGGKF
jgi:hypothetical protein